MNIFYINLDKSTDRKEQIENNLNKFNLKYNRISAIEGLKLFEEDYRKEISELLDIDIEKLTPQYLSSKSNFNTYDRDINTILPKVACFLSHFKTLHHAIQNNLENILILEDDAIIENLEFSYPPNASIVYLGGFFKHKPEKDSYYEHNKKSKFFYINSEYLTVFSTVAYYLPNRKCIEHLYNIYRRTLLDGKPKRKYNDNTITRLVAAPSDRMLINYLQKEGLAVVSQPQIVKPNTELKSTICNKQKYIKQQLKLKLEY